MGILGGAKALYPLSLLMVTILEGWSCSIVLKQVYGVCRDPIAIINYLGLSNEHPIRFNTEFIFLLTTGQCGCWLQFIFE